MSLQQIQGGVIMKTQQINKILDKMESWMKMTCEGCAMPEKLNPLINEVRRLLNSGSDNTPVNRQQK